MKTNKTDLYQFIKSSIDNVNNLTDNEVIIKIKKLLMTDKPKEAVSLCLLFDCTMEDLARSYYEKLKDGD